MRRSLELLSVIILLAVVVSGCHRNVNSANISAASATTDSTPLTKLTDMGVLPEFKLTDQSGRDITLADLKGKVWIADFFFTNCTGVCPMMTTHMSKLHKKLSPAGLHLLSISVDPAHDDQKTLTEYAKEHGADDKWIFATTEKAKIIDLSVKGFKLSADEDPTSHSQRLVLIDRSGHIRGYYRSDSDQEMAELAKNAEILLKN